MKTRLIVIIVIGGVLILSCYLYWCNKTDRNPAAFISAEPTYDGQTFTYWMNHLYGEYGRRNAEAESALRAMGAKAAPCLARWMTRSDKMDQAVLDFNYFDRGLIGFEILGPKANSATPQLIKSFGRNFGYSEKALVFIGKDAVPVLMDKLVETLSDTNNPFFQGVIRMGVRKKSGFYIRGSILRVFNDMGTNAEAAIPALIKCLNSKNEKVLWQQAQTAVALASVGRNQPDIVIPALMGAFTNTNVQVKNRNAVFPPGWNPTSARGAIAAALGSIGISRPNIVIPFLIYALTNSDAKVPDRGAVAGALTQVGRDQPNAIFPALIYALTSGDASATDREGIASSVAAVGHAQPDVTVPVLIFAFTNSTVHARCGIADALATFGNDAQSAIPFLLSAGQDRDWELRAHAAVAVKKIAPQTPNALTPLIGNLENQNGYVRYRALYELGRLRTNAGEALPVLRNVCVTRIHKCEPIPNDVFKTSINFQTKLLSPWAKTYLPQTLSRLEKQGQRWQSLPLVPSWHLLL